MFDEIHSYIRLQQQIHHALRVQHPEWVEPNGACPTCVSYGSRLAGAAWPFSPDEQRYTERRSFGSDSRNWVGERRTIRLNARLKFVMD
jgi:hypothetical protein